MSSSDITLMRAVDAVLDGQAARGGLEVHVARAGLERVVQGRAHQLDHRAVGFRGGFEGNFLRAAGIGVVRGIPRHAIHGAQPGLLLRKIGRHVVAAGEAVAERRGEALLDPVLRVEVERVAEHHRHRAFAVAQGDAGAARGLGVGNQVEGGLLLEELFQGDRRHAQSRRQVCDVFHHH
jgi:hypothetical protein